ncbi:MAG TPA: bifunctional diaminohydroxyphosphoribosylaminopyrimidine deaminase/5-amino-6-(5-phosphoribosylamino)uracil reductase RibD [Gemmatimonadaceae bacterium]|jgi:diaminohydroxyphosphoribosylaminopyrimidine deaminase/5-amino-6-(5-phosphoribosylamino)uracil reductase
MTSAAAATEHDAVYMRRALALATLGWGQTAPNPMVGAVVVANGQIVGEGFHAHYGGPHAEVMALERAAVLTRDATVYISLEPCAHYGKTAPCADALIAADVGRVVMAVSDPTRVAGGGATRLRNAGIQVDGDVERDAAIELNAPFFYAVHAARPWVTLKLALSADGAIAEADGKQRWLTGAASRAEVHRLRANTDAIAVGVGTVLADDPQLTVRDVEAPRIAPKRVVFDSTLRTPMTSRLMQTAGEVETILVARPGVAPDRQEAAEAAGASMLVEATLASSLETLRSRGVRSLFVEGGAQLAGSLLREGLVDRLIIFRTPVELGANALKAFASAPDGFEAALSDARHRVVEQRRFGDDTMTVYALREVPCSPG